VKNKLREKLEIQILCPEGTTKTHTHTNQQLQNTLMQCLANKEQRIKVYF